MKVKPTKIIAFQSSSGNKSANLPPVDMYYFSRRELLEFLGMMEPVTDADILAFCRSTNIVPYQKSSDEYGLVPQMTEANTQRFSHRLCVAFTPIPDHLNEVDSLTDAMICRVFGIDVYIQLSSEVDLAN